MASTPVRKPEQRRRMVLRLHLVRGSFSPADDASPSMDSEVWSKLPDEVIWEVVLRLPAAKHFQLQLVSRQWLQMLTSEHFRNRLLMAAAASAGSREQQQQQRVLACVCNGGARDSDSSDSSRRKVKVLDIDLSYFVPASFWKLDSFSVVAAGDGLVCISNDNEHLYEGNEDWDPWHPWVNSYCVVNPLTRTCTVLPRLPFLPLGWVPLTKDALTIYGHKAVATYNLAAAGDTAEWDLAYHEVDSMLLSHEFWDPPLVAVCGGETYVYSQRWVHLLVADPDKWDSFMDVEEPVDAPAVSLLGLGKAALSYFYGDGDVCLVAHRGAVFLGACLRRPRWDVAWAHVALGVWRLARDRLEWELVTCLHPRTIESLTGLRNLHDQDVAICGAYGAQEFLFCHVQVYPRKKTPTLGSPPSSILLGFNLDTGDWELLHHDRLEHWKPKSDLLRFPLPMELRPPLLSLTD